jgi:hypothetical protein
MRRPRDDDNGMRRPRDDAMYGRTTVRPDVDTRKDDIATTPRANRRLPIRTIGRTVVRPYIATSFRLSSPRALTSAFTIVARSSPNRRPVVAAGDYVRAKLRCAPFCTHIHRPYSRRYRVGCGCRRYGRLRRYRVGCVCRRIHFIWWMENNYYFCDVGDMTTETGPRSRVPLSRSILGRLL